MNPGNGHGVYPNNDTPGGKVVVAGAVPDVTSAGVCRWRQDEVDYYRQPDNPQNLFSMSYTNSGTVKCGLTATWIVL